MATNGYESVKVFSASKHMDRDRLGETVSTWLAANRHLEVVETVTLQSSDQAFHCLTMILFVRPRASAAA